MWIRDKVNLLIKWIDYLWSKRLITKKNNQIKLDSSKIANNLGSPPKATMKKSIN